MNNTQLSGHSSRNNTKTTNNAKALKWDRSSLIQVASEQ